MNALRRKPLFVASFLALLALGQVRALREQFRAGFFPFRSPPVRVPFSWDMFAIPITRCDIEWTPPLPIGRGYRHLRDFGAPFEWDPVYNAESGYLNAALAGCSVREQPSYVRVICMTPLGRNEHAFDCP